MSEQTVNNLTSNNSETSAQNSRKTQESASAKQNRRKLPKKKKLLLLLGAVVIASAVAIYLGTMKNNSAPLLQTATVTKETIVQSILATGAVSGSDSAEIGSNLNFEFIQINVKEGDKVKKGDILGVLDSKTLQDDYDIAVKELQISQAQLNEQRNTATIAVKERQMDYDEAKRQNDIAKQLYANGGISNDEMVQSNMALEKARLALSAAKDSLERASASGSAALGIGIKQDIISSKKDNLDKANITSPIDGTVTRVNAKLGRIPTAQDMARAMFIVENLDDLLIKVSVSEYDISRIKVGQKVRITSDVLRGEEIGGVVSRIAPTGEVVQGAATKEMRIPVEIKITEKGSIIAGVNAKTEIIIEEKEQVLAVPVESILPDGEESFILVGNDNMIKKVKVQTGLEGITKTEIISDEIKEGDVIITNPSLDYADGSSFRTQE